MQGTLFVSRSVKRNGYVTDNTCKRRTKRQANHRVRRVSDVPSGGAYRKFFEPWVICDWRLPARPKGSAPDAYRDWMK